MGDKCYKCGDVSNGDCASCHRAVCKHSKGIGEHVLCREWLPAIYKEY